MHPLVSAILVGAGAYIGSSGMPVWGQVFYVLFFAFIGALAGK